jgi:transposase-like protein
MFEIKEIEYLILVVSILITSVFAYFYFRKFTINESCPQCGNKRDLERIRKVEMLKHIPFINLKHFKCYKCNKTHYQVQFKTHSNFVNNRIE